MITDDTMETATARDFIASGRHLHRRRRRHAHRACRPTAETRRVLCTGGRVVVSTPGAAQPPLEILGNALAEHVSPQVGSFLRAVFSLHDPSAVAGMLVEAGFDDVQATTSVIPLDVPSPVEFLWQYIGSTPLGPVVNRASVETKSALERDVVGQWQAFVDGQGRLAIDQPMVYARATAP